MARGFVNLNRFKHGRAVKRDSRQRMDLPGKRKAGKKGRQGSWLR